MTKYKVGDYIKASYDTSHNKIVKAKIIEVDGSFIPYKVMFVDGKERWIDESDIVEDEQNELEERYTTGSGKQLFEVLEDDLLEPDETRGFYKGNIYKYVKRYPKKNGIEDLEKAKDYINQLIELEMKLGGVD